MKLPETYADCLTALKEAERASHIAGARFRALDAQRIIFLCASKLEKLEVEEKELSAQLDDKKGKKGIVEIRRQISVADTRSRNVGWQKDAAEKSLASALATLKELGVDSE